MHKVPFTAILAVLVTAVSLPLFAQDASDFEFYDGRITGYTGTSKDVVIPGQINGIPVTSIGEDAFKMNQLTSVTIPNSVTSIGGGAFYDNQLTSVTIPNSVTSIGVSAFYRNQLTSVTIPDNLAIANDTFSDTFDGFLDYYSSIGRKAGTYSATGKSWLRPLSDAEAALAATEDDFDIEQLVNGTLRITGYSGKARNVVIPDAISGIRVTSIGTRAFQDKGLYSVVIPDGIIELGESEWGSGSAFFNNNLTRISIGKGLKTILGGTFSGNKNLTTLVIPDGITEIGQEAFSGCGLSGAGITWGKGLVKIGDRAFEKNNLTELTLPNSVTLVGDGAFAGNPLTAIVFPASLAQYAGYFSRNPRGSAGAFTNSGTDVTRITVPANMAEENLGGLPVNFLNFWKNQNKAAGTYVLKGRIWVRE
ncbi:hypothetical protein FACS189491_04630 [Spirochaetia bacterium]|nr:hypothetical protein FACS189491_04630 [Spirochaetia bacterium]